MFFANEKIVLQSKSFYDCFKMLKKKKEKHFWLGRAEANLP